MYIVNLIDYYISKILCNANYIISLCAHTNYIILY